jgi:hypothetical protein
MVKRVENVGAKRHCKTIKINQLTNDSGTVVDHSTYNPKVEGTKKITKIGNYYICKVLKEQICVTLCG